MSLAARIEALLVERLQEFAPDLDVSPGSAAYTSIVEPIVGSVSPDPIDTDPREFILETLGQEYPELSLEDSDAVVGYMVNPLALLQAPLKAELEHIRAGQTVARPELLTTQQAEDLAANWFVPPREQGRARSIVQIQYEAPQTVTIDRNTVFLSGSLQFFPTRTTTIRADVMLRQRIGRRFFVEVPVVAAEPGEEYNVGEGAIQQVQGIEGATLVRNVVPATGGLPVESATQLLQSVENALVERSLVVRRGILARLRQDFGAQLRDISVVGAGDPEMMRDRVSVDAPGKVAASGVSLVVGQFCFLISMYEDRSVQVEEGDYVSLQYWGFLYPQDFVQKVRVEQVLFSTREATPQLPSIIMLKLSESPTSVPPVGATIPGTYPGVFVSIQKPASVFLGGEEVGDDVSLRGMVDIYVRPTSPTPLTTNLACAEGEDILAEGADLATFPVPESDDPPSALAKIGTIRGTPVGAVIGEGTFLSKSGMPALKVLKVLSEDTFLVVPADLPPRLPSVGAVLDIGEGAGTLTVTEASPGTWEGTGFDGAIFAEDLVLEVLSGPQRGRYSIINTQLGFLSISPPFSTDESGFSYRIVRSVRTSVHESLRVKFPAVGATGTLATTVGMPLVRSTQDLAAFGAEVGDLLEIEEGPDKGRYEIVGFDPVLGGLRPILNQNMRSSGSGLSFRLFAEIGGAQRPFVALRPGGVQLLDADSGLGLGDTIPPGVPVRGEFRGEVLGASVTGRGAGFVLPDPGPAWQPEYDQTSGGCYSTECKECEGFIATIYLNSDGEAFLDVGFPSNDPATFFTQLRQWVLDVIDALGLPADLTAFVEMVAPLRLQGPQGTIVWQTEVCLPRELADSRNNVFLALPNLNWEEAFQEYATFEAMYEAFDNGTFPGSFSPEARPGVLEGTPESLEVGGSSYRIQKVYRVPVPVSGSIVDSIFQADRVHEFAIVVVKDEFPVSPLTGLQQFFSEGVPSLEVPQAPVFDITAKDSADNPVSPWELVQEVVRFLFQWADAAGFNIPESFTLDASKAAEGMWSSIMQEYLSGTPTGKNLLRLFFQEPVMFEALSPSFYLPLEAGLMEEEGPLSFESSADLTLPIEDLSGARFRYWIKGPEKTWLIEGTLPGNAGDIDDPDELRTLLEDEIKPTIPPFASLDTDFEDDRVKLVFRVPDGPPFEDPREWSVELDSDIAGVFQLLQIYPLFRTHENVETMPLQLGEREVRAATKFFARHRPDVEFVPEVPYSVLSQPPEGSIPRDLVFNRGGGFRDSYDVGTEPWHLHPYSGTDALRVYQQRILNPVPDGSATAKTRPDRVVGVRTEGGSRVLTLPPDTPYTFIGRPEAKDHVLSGDILYIEDGVDAGQYRVVDVQARRLTVDRPLRASTMPVLYRGTTGSISRNDTKIIVPSLGVPADFLVGKWITVWGSPGQDIDGTYQIGSVDTFSTPGAAELDVSREIDFPQDSVDDFLWEISEEQPQALQGEGVESFSPLMTVVPVRIYGSPVIHRINLIAPSGIVANSRAGKLASEPAKGIRQPYEVLRMDTFRVTAKEMRDRGADPLGRYSVDIPVRSLGCREAHNLPERSSLDIRMGTFHPRGYWLRSRDENLTFSGRELTDMIIPARFLPPEREAAQDQFHLSPSLEFAAEYMAAPVVEQLQGFFSSALDRNLCSDVLVKHFAPGFVGVLVYSDDPAVSARASQAISRAIDDHPSDRDLTVAQVETAIRTAGVLEYEHPVVISVMVHGTDRRVREILSEDAITDDLLRPLTHRTVHYISGDIGEDSESFGARIWIGSRAPQD